LFVLPILSAGPAVVLRDLLPLLFHTARPLLPAAWFQLGAPISLP
jgi:hypothetical protein